MQKLVSSNGKKYAVLNYEQLNENGLKKLTTGISSNGINVVKIIPADTARKKDGIPTKTFSLIAEDGQKMDVQVNDTGDISSVKLNGKVFPLKSPSSISDLSKQIALSFKNSSASFASSLAKKLAKATRDEAKKTDKPAVKSNTQRLQEAKEKSEKIKNDIKNLNKTIATRNKIKSKVNEELESARAQLNAERAITRSLKDEVAKLEG
ncbi:MAG: hypothetical protein ACRC6N_11185 [Plesiomonas sp.]|uniref:defense against restriction DarA-related protein n=1 Tax=Plesiomonas sp. TaxID=2486279 RepID=UPI003F2EAE48